MAEPPRRHAQIIQNYVSTGHLPPSDTVALSVTEAHRRFKADTEGENSNVYPALALMPRELSGVCLVDITGGFYVAGDADYEFSIMSVSKPFVFALD
jgi:glutaminase